MASLSERLASNKERLLFAAALAGLLASLWLTLRPAPPPPPLPAEPRVAPVASAGAVLGVELLYASGDYWDDLARYVFVQPPTMRVFRSVALEVPTISVPRPPLPLPSPGPRLEYTGELPRLGDSAPLTAPAAPAPAPAAPAAPVPPAAGAGAAPGGGK